MSWEGSLELGFAAEGGTTWLAHRAHRGPLCVQRPFQPEGPGVCHVYVLHPPGGLVGGDALSLAVRTEPGAAALVTTPAAGKAYRTLGPPVRQVSELHVAGGASLEWLPAETIVYDGARATFDTRVRLEPGARFVGMETICLGLPARGEPFARGWCRQLVEIRRTRRGRSSFAGPSPSPGWLREVRNPSEGSEDDDRPLFVERSRFDGGGPVLERRWGLGGATVVGLLTAVPAPEPARVDELRARAAAVPAGEAAAVTVVGRGENATLVCRTVGASAERSREFLHDVWRLVRPALLGRPAVAPRIWAT